MITRHCSVSALRSTRAAMPSTDSVSRMCHVLFRRDGDPSRRITRAGINGIQPITDSRSLLATSAELLIRLARASQNTTATAGPHNPANIAMTVNAIRIMSLDGNSGGSALPKGAVIRGVE